MTPTLKRLVPRMILPMVLLAAANALHQRSQPEAEVAEMPESSEMALNRDTAFVPYDRPDLAIYSARAEGESQTKVFVESAGRALLVYVDPEPGELVDVSRDGTRGIFERYLSPGQSVYIAIDFRRHRS